MPAQRVVDWLANDIDNVVAEDQHHDHGCS